VLAAAASTAPAVSHPMGCPRYQDCKGGAGSVVAGDVPPGAVVAGNPARVIKQVAELTCPPGWFEHPYTWPPYAAPEPFDPGDACDDVPPRYEPPTPS